MDVWNSQELKTVGLRDCSCSGEEGRTVNRKGKQHQQQQPPNSDKNQQHTLSTAKPTEEEEGNGGGAASVPGLLALLVLTSWPQVHKRMAHINGQQWKRAGTEQEDRCSREEERKKMVTCWRTLARGSNTAQQRDEAGGVVSWQGDEDVEELIPRRIKKYKMVKVDGLGKKRRVDGDAENREDA